MNVFSIPLLYCADYSIGKIPLRQLVYRVLDLPQSMRPLVYDFGQLKTDTEGDYIKQIVKDHVRCVVSVAQRYIVGERKSIT